jgi:crotonobetainyl-CoA:carnitine CoA-transferase CaiB-like acyl-CoA transferase
MRAQILDGIRVLELAQGMAGPVAAMLLAESGADVIKIEPPGGDPTRAKSGFAVWNRSKRSVVLDRTRGGGRTELGRLLESADVLIHDLGPKAAAASGLDDATLGARHPQLITCSVPAFPVPHPDADRVARDTLVLARAGVLDEQQAVGRAGPTFLRIPLCSIGAWHLAAAGVVARLIARERDGIGGPAHTSLLQGALVPLTMHWARAERPTQSFARGMPKDAGDSLFQCGDGLWIHLMANPDGSLLMQEVFAEMGEEGVRQANARHKAGQMGTSHPNYGANVEALMKRPRQEWLESLWASDVPVQPCLALGELYFDEQANINEYVVEVDDPEWGTTRQPGHPYATVPTSRVKGPAPTLGQHTEEVRSEEGSAGFEIRGTSTGKPPLDGLKVLDFGNFLAGPLAAMLMADLGADVIKLEATTGDMMRHSVERVFSGCQRGKRGIALNLKHSDTRPVVEKLVQWADVVHHNLRYPAARRLRIDYESLKELNPKLIYCHTSSYGPKGPRADWPGFDQLFQAASGWEYEGAGEGNRPMWHRFGMMDHQNALASLTATLLAIYHRMRTGEPQFCSASLLGASILTTSETFVRPDATLAPYPKLDTAQMGVSPFHRIFECSDKRWIAVVAESERERAGLLRAAGVDSPGELEAAVSAISQEPMLWQLAREGVPAEPVQLNQQDAFFAAQGSMDSDLVARYPHPTWGIVEQIGSLWNMGDLPPRLDRASPTLGQHSREICEEIGLDPKVYETLKAKQLLVGD